jgi:hypothetical protein
MSDLSAYACGYEVSGDGTARPRPIPEAIRSLADPVLKEDAQAAWEAASRLFRLIDQWRHWFNHINTTGDADPAFVISLSWAITTCVNILRALGFDDRPVQVILSAFPGLPDFDLGYDLRLMSWRDGSGVPTSGKRLILVGTDDNGLLHIRIFAPGGNWVVDTDETKEPPEKAGAIATLKRGLQTLMPPRELTNVENGRIIDDISSIVGEIWGLTPPWQREPGWLEQTRARLSGIYPIQGSLSRVLRSLESAPGVVVRRPERWRPLLSSQHPGRPASLPATSGPDPSPVSPADSNAKALAPRANPKRPTGATPTTKRLKEPPREAFQAYYLYLAWGNQTEVAKKMSEELRRPINQGTVSRWCNQVSEWIGDGNPRPEFPSKTILTDPAILDKGVGRKNNVRRNTDS